MSSEALAVAIKKSVKGHYLLHMLNKIFYLLSM